VHDVSLADLAAIKKKKKKKKKHPHARPVRDSLRENKPIE